MIRANYALDQRDQDNKFVESGLRNWVWKLGLSKYGLPSSHVQR